MKQLSQTQFLALIRDDVEEAGSQKAVAKQLSISESYLSDILNGRRSAGETVLRHYGLRAVTNYTPLEKEKE